MKIIRHITALLSIVWDISSNENIALNIFVIGWGQALNRNNRLPTYLWQRSYYYDIKVAILGITKRVNILLSQENKNPKQSQKHLYG